MPRIQHKRGTSANLAGVNPTPLAGELVWDSTENAIKIGDGATAWTSLAYVTATPRTHTHSADAITSGTIDYARLPVGSTTSTVCAGDDARLTDARTPTAHKSTHATGGSDALTPADIGAAPAASPVITGNATFEASSGVPVTITNTGTGNSFVINDASGDATPFVVDASGNVGIGSATANAKLSFGSFSASTSLADNERTTAHIRLFEQGSIMYGFSVDAVGLFSMAANNSGSAGQLRFVTNSTERMRIAPGGNVGIGRTSPATALDVNGVITVSATSGSAGSYLPSVTISGDANTGFGQVSGQSDTASVFTAGHERVRVDSSGRVRIYQTASDGTGVGRCEFMAHGGTTVSGGFILYGASYASGIYMGLGVSSLHLYNSGGHCSLSTTTGHDVVLGTNSLARVRVKSTGALRFVPLSADPASGEAGDVYYNSSTNKLRVYDGTSWIDLH